MTRNEQIDVIEMIAAGALSHYDHLTFPEGFARETAVRAVEASEKGDITAMGFLRAEITKAAMYGGFIMPGNAPSTNRMQ